MRRNWIADVQQFKQPSVHSAPKWIVPQFCIRITRRGWIPPLQNSISHRGSDTPIPLSGPLHCLVSDLSCVYDQCAQEKCWPRRLLSSIHEYLAALDWSVRNVHDVVNFASFAKSIIARGHMRECKIKSLHVLHLSHTCGWPKKSDFKNSVRWHCLLKLIKYILRFHFRVASGQAKLDTLHRAFTAQYRFKVKAQYIANQSEENFLVVLVTIIVVTMLNTCVSCVSWDINNQPE